MQMTIPGLSSSSSIDRVDSGTGYIHEHSLEVGLTVIVFRNIGTITIRDGRNNPAPLVIGIAVALMGLGLLGALKTLGILLLLSGSVLVAWALLRSPDNFLSIGTCDGRQTYIVSKDRPGLARLRDFLRDRIEKKVGGEATISISANRIEFSGGVAFGANAQAAGRDGEINNGRRP